MDNASNFLHEWSNHTTVHPLALTLLVVAGIFLCALPRRWAFVPIAVIACFVAPAQRIVILECDFTFVRVLLLVGLLRTLFFGELRDVRGSVLDMAVSIWAITRLICHGLLSGTTSEWIRSAGVAFDALATYFLFRAFILSMYDMKCIVKAFALLAVPVALGFIVENTTAHNVFSVFGGVPETTVIRDGKLRCQGAFAHPIVAGCFWAALLPLFIALWNSRIGLRAHSVAGLIGGLCIIALCNSSTPLGGVAAAGVGGCFFYLRYHMRIVRWGLLILIVVLHLVMKAPVWHLISRVDLVGGSTGYHRFLLIDNAIRRVDEWWLLGTRSTEHWGYGLTDVCVQYVYEAVEGGLATLVLFVLMLALAFRAAGRIVGRTECTPAHRGLAWALGVSVFVHAVNFIGLSYFGQAELLWGICLASLGSLDTVAPSRCAIVARRSNAASLKVLLQPGIS